MNPVFGLPTTRQRDRETEKQTHMDRGKRRSAKVAPHYLMLELKHTYYRVRQRTGRRDQDQTDRQTDRKNKFISHCTAASQVDSPNDRFQAYKLTDGQTDRRAGHLCSSASSPISYQAAVA